MSEVHEMLGEVLRHEDVLGASHGCVEVTRVRCVIETLIAEKNSTKADAENYRAMLREVDESRNEIIKRIRDWQSMPDDAFRLRGGEMTAQEIRTVRAFLNVLL